jgi:hypothetical protein
MKSKGLQKLRWYCQVCEKQCRDENGFKCHMQSEGHLRQMLVVGESAGRHIHDYSMQFQHDFVQLLSRRCVHEFRYHLYPKESAELTIIPVFQLRYSARESK